MKRIQKMLLLLVTVTILLSLMACGGNSDSGNREDGSKSENKTMEAVPNKDEDTDKQTENADPIETESQKLTLDEAEVRLLYHEDKYVVVLYHGPDEDINMHFCMSDGTAMENGSLCNYARMKPNWRIVIMKEMPEAYSIDEIAFSVKDRDAEGMPERVFTDLKNTESVTRKELEDLGLYYLEDIPFLVEEYAPAYSDDDIEVSVYLNGMFENRNITNEQWPFTIEAFQVFAGDGTPLGDYFEGYDLELKTREDKKYIKLVLEVVDGNESESRNKAMCDELRACKPYMVYTASDGATVTIPLLQGEE